MSRTSTLLALSAASALAVGLVGCSADAGATDDAPAASADFSPITIEHALGTTTIETKPERVATVNWANQEVPLALGVVPVGMARADFGDDDGDGVLPWVSEKLDELGGETPVLFDETDGVDFEAVADTEPDVILAAYSGLTQEDYDTLSEIAPVVAYPETAWGTSWRDMIELNSTGMGMAAEGEQLVADLEEEIAGVAADHPALADKTAMFLTHVDTTDLSEVSFYTTHDTRVQFFDDLGLQQPQSIADASAATDLFSLTQSAETADTFDDVDVIVTYGDEELVKTLESDPVLSQMPAVANEAIVALPGTGSLGTAANPTPLSISWILDEYADLLDEAAAKS
ncbi:MULTISPECIES: iron-siderophore ABC transporter substrate-binding protein [unclassified Frigoribacterium]|jgi:iron complex transport system substrate-binding protein|uniref:iron-siderophore ABC transporter substrate-binding protein n=1 Tax=unclassified Frigoribacterium TaxID=2627005 RepID=UPI0006F6AF4E|nr:MULTISPECIES: iron-siderophore ABC transporter substrate-binding protein [unclassified Frigoribacterium]KQO80132.1 ABC transporter substrate-binding protein [Frigoribacterium sp. Leaf263]KQR62032.1 ABC transporter substrate-binding protein [Frigoribacterium sp. Leaf172]